MLKKKESPFSSMGKNTVTLHPQILHQKEVQIVLDLPLINHFFEFCCKRMVLSRGLPVHIFYNVASMKSIFNTNLGYFQNTQHFSLYAYTAHGCSGERLYHVLLCWGREADMSCTCEITPYMSQVALLPLPFPTQPLPCLLLRPLSLTQPFLFEARGAEG